MQKVVPICFPMTESKKGYGFGRIWEDLGKENSNQNILYKTLFSTKKEKRTFFVLTLLQLSDFVCSQYHATKRKCKTDLDVEISE